jgi:fibronectin-binding autotransporter adhesin
MRETIRMRRILTVGFALAALWALGVRLAATATVTWDGGASTLNWGDGANWNPDTAAGGPPNGSVIQFNGGSAQIAAGSTVTLSAGSDMYPNAAAGTEIDLNNGAGFSIGGLPTWTYWPTIKVQDAYAYTVVSGSSGRLAIGGTTTVDVVAGGSLEVNGGFTVAGYLTGFLNKAGAGTLYLTGGRPANASVVHTTVQGGTLSTASVNNLGTGHLAVQTGGRFEYTGTGSEAKTGLLYWNYGDGTIDVTSATANLTFNVTGGDLTSGGGTFTKAGPGTLTLATSGADIVLGKPVALNNGTLALQSSGSNVVRLTSALTGAAGTTLQVLGGTLDVAAGGSISSATATSVASSATLKYSLSGTTIANSISGSGTWSLAPAAATSPFVVTGNNRSFTGTLNIGYGARFYATTVNALPADTAQINVAAGGQLFYVGTGCSAPITIAGKGWANGEAGYGDGQGLGAIRLGGTYNGNVTLAAAARIETYNDGHGTLNGSITLGGYALDLYTQSHNLTLNGNITGNSASQVIKLGGTGTSVLLAGDNSSFSGTYNNNSGNTFFIGSNSGSAAATWTVNAGILANMAAGAQAVNLGALSGTAGSVGNNAAGSTVTYSIGGLGTSTSYGGSIVDSVGSGGTTAIKKVGGGTLTLSGANTYSGGTTINGGALKVAADNNLGASSGALAFGGGALQNTSSFTLGSARAVTLNAGGGTFNIDPSTTLTVTQGITGAGSLTKAGAGTLVLSGNSTYSGATTVSGGTLQLQAPTAPVAGSILWLDARDINGNGSSVSNGATVTTWVNKAGGSVANFTNSTGSGGTYAVSSTVVTGAPSVHLDGSTILSTATAITAPVSIFYVGGMSATNQYRLMGSVSQNFLLGYWGGTMNGTYWAGVGGYSTAIPADTNAHIWVATNTAGGAYFAYRLDRGDVEQGIGSGTGASASTPGRLALGGGNGGAGEMSKGDISEVLVYSGVLSESDRKLVEQYLQAKWFGVLPPATAVSLTASGATLDLNGVTQTIGSLAGVAGSQVLLGGGALTVGLDGTSTEFSGAISGSGSVAKIGDGTLALAGDNTYNGTTTIHSGVLQIGGGGGAAGTLGTGAVIDNASLVFNRTGTITVANAISGIGTLTQSSPSTGTLILTNANTYSGGTAVTGGTLLVSNSTGSGTGSGPVAVSGGLLGGNGTIGGSVGVLSGGTIGAGESAGLLSIDGDYSQTGTGILWAELGGTTAGIGGYDQIAVTGHATLAPGTVIDVDLIDGFQPASGDRFEILTTEAGFVDTDASMLSLDVDDAKLLAGQYWIAQIVDLPGLGAEAQGLELMVGVPEPSTLVLAVLGLLGLFLAGRRRRATAV